MLDVKVYSTDGKVVRQFTDLEDVQSDESVDFVSLVSASTYGPPALVAPDPKKPGQPPTARPGERVLFINTAVVPMWLIERIGDD